MAFAAPIADQLLALKACAGIEELAGHERFAAAMGAAKAMHISLKQGSASL